MQDVYFGEIRVFQSANEADKTAFNLRKGLQPTETVEELIALNDTWDYEFLPPLVGGNSSAIGVAATK